MPSLLPTLKRTSLWILRSLRFPSSLFVLWRDVINCGSPPPPLGRQLQQWRRLLFAGSWMKPQLGLAHHWHALPAGLRGLPEAMTSFTSGLRLPSCKRWEASPRHSTPLPSPLYFPQLAFIAVSHFPTGFPFQTRCGIYLLLSCNPSVAAQPARSDDAVFNTYGETIKATAAFNGTFSLFFEMVTVLIGKVTRTERLHGKASPGLAEHPLSPSPARLPCS